MDRNTPVTELPAVGPARAKALARLGIRTAGDLLGHYPRAYDDRTRTAEIAQAPNDRPVCVEALVADVPRLSRIRRGLELVKVRVADGSGVIAGGWSWSRSGWPTAPASWTLPFSIRPM